GSTSEELCDSRPTRWLATRGSLDRCDIRTNEKGPAREGEAPVFSVHSSINRVATPGIRPGLCLRLAFVVQASRLPIPSRQAGRLHHTRRTNRGTYTSVESQTEPNMNVRLGLAERRGPHPFATPLFHDGRVS